MNNTYIPRSAIASRWRTSTVEEMAAEFGLSLNSTYYWIRRHGFRRSELLTTGNLERQPEDPTEEQIAERAAVVRRGWSKTERRSRAKWAYC